MRSKHRTMLRLTLVHFGHTVIEVVMELRERHPYVKVIAISGADSGDYLDPARLMGAAKVLLKPFRNEVVMTPINDALPDGV